MGQALYTMQQTAKFVSFGEKKLFKLLRDKRILNTQNLPYQRYIDRGLFAVDTKGWQHISIGERLYGKTLVTIKGVEFLQKIVSDASHERQ